MRAIALPLDTRGIVQIALDLVNVRITQIKQAFDVIKSAALNKDMQIAGSEIIGLIPKEASFSGMKEYLKLENWDGSRIIENHL